MACRRRQPGWSSARTRLILRAEWKTLPFTSTVNSSGACCESPNGGLAPVPDRALSSRLQVVLMQAAVELQESTVRSLEDIDGSIVHQVIVQACRSSEDPASQEQAMFRALKTRPPLAVAMLESAVKDVRHSTLEALKAGVR